MHEGVVVMAGAGPRWGEFEWRVGMGGGLGSEDRVHSESS